MPGAGPVAGAPAGAEWSPPWAAAPGATRRRRARAVRRGLLRHRRAVAAGLFALSAGLAVRELRPAPPPQQRVLVAVRDLPAGHRVEPADLTAAAWPVAVLPQGVVAEPAGGVLAGAVRRGEPLTDTRLLGPGLLGGQPPGLVALAIRVGDPAALLPVRVGGRVQVLAGSAAAADLPLTAAGTEPTGAPAAPLVTSALVLAVPGRPAEAGPGDGLGGGLFGAPGGSDPGGVVILALDPGQAARVAGAAQRQLTVAALPDPVG